VHNPLLESKITAIQIGISPLQERRLYEKFVKFLVLMMRRKFAMNLKVPFFTPEEYFLGDKPADYILGAFNPLDYISTPTIPSSDTTISLDTPDTTIPPDTSDTSTVIVTMPIPVAPIIRPPEIPDVVLFVGSPASGKSTFFREHLAPIGYERINQDTLKTRDRCVMEATALLEKNIPIAIGNSLLIPT
jgi:bifunctional polynucleotide phosphatase/kinase